MPGFQVKLTEKREKRQLTSKGILHSDCRSCCRCIYLLRLVSSLAIPPSVFFFQLTKSNLRPAPGDNGDMEPFRRRDLRSHGRSQQGAAEECNAGGTGRYSPGLRPVCPLVMAETSLSESAAAVVKAVPFRWQFVPPHFLS